MSYTYLVGSLATLAVWAVIFYLRKDLRKPMLIMGAIIGILGVITEQFIWTKDQWHPPTITGTPAGIEDLIFGFAIAGIVLALYPFLFNKTFTSTKKHNNDQTMLLILLFLVSPILTLFLHVNSVISWLVVSLAGTIVIFILQPRLIAYSLITGVAITIMAIPIYIMMQLIEPGMGMQWWFLENLSGLFFIGIPVEDFLWFFTVGTFLGPLYAFWHSRIEDYKG